MKKKKEKQWQQQQLPALQSARLVSTSSKRQSMYHHFFRPTLSPQIRRLGPVYRLWKVMTGYSALPFRGVVVCVPPEPKHVREALETEWRWTGRRKENEGECVCGERKGWRRVYVGISVSVWWKEMKREVDLCVLCLYCEKRCKRSICVCICVFVLWKEVKIEELIMCAYGFVMRYAT